MCCVLNAQVVPVHMWFGFLYALAYLCWTMIYFGWRGRWIYEFLDWSRPVQRRSQACCNPQYAAINAHS